MLRVLLLYQVNQAVAADRIMVSVTVNPTPAVGPVPPVKMVSTTCSSKTTLVARVGLLLHTCAQHTVGAF